MHLVQLLPGGKRSLTRQPPPKKRLLEGTALPLVIDVQNGVVEGADEPDMIVANVGAVVDKARAADVPVVWVKHRATTCRREASGGRSSLS